MREVEISRIAYGGAGIGRLDGKVVFVPFTIPGERAGVRVVREQKQYSEAEVVQLLRPAPERRIPRCEVFGRCGGCAYQHVDYALQLEWKVSQVRDLFQRVGKLPDAPVEAALPSPLEWGFRNRIRVHAKDGRVGFYGRNGHRIVDVRECAIASPGVNEALLKLRRSKPESGEYTLSGRGSVRFFEQTNDGAAAVLAGLVEEVVGSGRATLVDAYSGAGFFGRRLAPCFEAVIGIESHDGAVAEARRRAGEKERYISGDVAAHLGSVLDTLDRARSAVLLDPPAAGVSARVTDLLMALPVDMVVYVSCDPATQARDIGSLVRGGYRLERVIPVDMFPQTADIEVVAVLRGSAKELAHRPQPL
jgi:23S rRNA (uracil1939-C5)-methyltransferase